MKMIDELLKELYVRFGLMVDLQIALRSPETSETEKEQIKKEYVVLKELQASTEAALAALLAEKKPSLFKRIFKK